MIEVIKEKGQIREDLFLWPEEDKKIWAEAAYPDGQWTNYDLMWNLEQIKPNFSLLDIGCGNGLFVKNLIEEGHFAIGIDGCHYYPDYPGFLWKDYPEHAILCDVSSKYEIRKDGELVKFDFITSWEHLEHLLEEQVDGWLENVIKHSHQDTKYVFSVSFRPTGGHFTIKPYGWWMEKFNKFGFYENLEFAQQVNRKYVRHLSDSYYYHLTRKN